MGSGGASSLDAPDDDAGGDDNRSGARLEQRVDTAFHPRTGAVWFKVRSAL